jgi:hypothetical protein
MISATQQRMRPHFRFEDLEIWQLARTLAVKLLLPAMNEALDALAGPPYEKRKSAERPKA